MGVERFTPEMTDRRLTVAICADGAYTAVGTYDSHAIVQRVTQPSTLTSIPSPRLLHTSHARGCV